MIQILEKIQSPELTYLLFAGLFLTSLMMVIFYLEKVNLNKKLNNRLDNH
ncbi:protein of unknown function [Tenacibaculum sp. 190524A02b]